MKWWTSTMLKQKIKSSYFGVQSTKVGVNINFFLT